MIDKSCARPSNRKKRRIKNKRADNPPYNSDPTNGRFLKIKLKTLSVRKLVLLARWVLTKYAIEEQREIPLQEYQLLLEIFLRLNKRHWSRGKTQKEVSLLFVLHALFQNVENESFSPKKSEIKFVLLDEFTYYGILHNDKWIERLYAATFVVNESVSRKTPSKFVGVGYKDKGYHAPVHSRDPHWTELAIHFERTQTIYPVPKRKREIKVIKRE